MKNTLLGLSCVAVLALSSCGKDKNPVQATSVDEQEVITQFVNVVGNPNYVEIQAKATALDAAITAYLATPTDDTKLAAARAAWKAARQPWEQAEGFLFGPVEDEDYDPTMDSWPLNRTDVDKILTSGTTLTFSYVDGLDGFSKGFHGIEYIIFGPGGRKAADINARQRDYLKYASQSLLATTTALRGSWSASGGNYAAQITTAGKGSTAFKTRKDLFLAIAKGMADICEEVGTGKMEEPYAAKDSTLDESSYSHNTTTDFTNNVKGILNVYAATYNGASGTASLSALVASKNVALDAKIKTQVQTVLSNMALITPTFEDAIYHNRDKIKNTQDALATLQATLEGDLKTFIQTNIKD
ncbi:imelysin family protein [Mucilaginibacter sp. CAU 1740]|uniref:imelysin family protein n=1 Tax=Mucilaginibacter sp. CAU 1740 TaxID=3140365 RepID=UPI00325BF052